MIHKFSISQTIDYAYKTYVKNFKFFLRIFGLISIGSIFSYYANLYIPNISFPLSIINFFVQFLGVMIFDYLITKNYDNSNYLSFKDIFNYDFNILSYLIYYLFIYFVGAVPALALGSLKSGSQGSIFIGSLIAISVSLYFTLEYFLGKYLILDKKLTLIQSLRAIPYLVSGEKKRILLTWIICAFVIALPYVIFALIGSYLLFGSIQNIFNPFFSAPFIIAYSNPLYSMVNVYIYEQLIENADEAFKKKLADFQELNEK